MSCVAGITCVHMITQLSSLYRKHPATHTENHTTMFPLGVFYSRLVLSPRNRNTLKLTREHMNTVQTSVRRIDRSITINKALHKSSVHHLAAAHACVQARAHHLTDPSVTTHFLCVAFRRVSQATTTDRNKHTQLLDPSVTTHFLCVALRRVNQATTTDRNKHTQLLDPSVTTHFLCVAFRRVNHATTTDRNKHTQLLDPSVTTHFLCVALRRVNQATTTERNKHTQLLDPSVTTHFLCVALRRVNQATTTERNKHTQLLDPRL